MKNSRLKWAALLCLAALSQPAAWAAPRSIESFDGTAWHKLTQSITQPTAVVFSTTDCTHCPKVIAQLAREAKQRGFQATLVVVVLDGAGADLLRNAHYQPADRLFVFTGPDAPLRHSVDPRWRGMTPFVGLLNPQQPAVLKAGPPSPEAIEAWARVAREGAAR